MKITINLIEIHYGKHMVSREFQQFALNIIIFTVVVFIGSALLTPPDPHTQILVFTALYPFVLAGSYTLAYTVGYEWP